MFTVPLFVCEWDETEVDTHPNQSFCFRVFSWWVLSSFTTYHPSPKQQQRWNHDMKSYPLGEPLTTHPIMLLLITISTINCSSSVQSKPTIPNCISCCTFFCYQKSVGNKYIQWGLFTLFYSVHIQCSGEPKTCGLLCSNWVVVVLRFFELLCMCLVLYYYISLYCINNK